MVESTTSLPSSSLTNTLMRPVRSTYSESVSSPSLMITAFLGNERTPPWGARSCSAFSSRAASGPIPIDTACEMDMTFPLDDSTPILARPGRLVHAAREYSQRLDGLVPREGDAMHDPPVTVVVVHRVVL